MTPEEIYEKQTGVPATYPFYVHSVGYVKWLEEQNAKLLEACKGLIGILTPKQYERQFPHVYQKARQAIAEAEGRL
jgi:hypothetical protein